MSVREKREKVKKEKKKISSEREEEGQQFNDTFSLKLVLQSESMVTNGGNFHCFDFMMKVWWWPHLKWG